MIDGKKLALLHVAKKRLGLDDDQWRALLERAAGVRSSKDLDAAGFASVMDELDRLGFVSTSRANNFGGSERAIGMASPALLARIRNQGEAFFDRAESAEAAEKALETWMRRRFGVGGLRMLDTRTAQKVTAALADMTRRKTEKAAREREDA